MRSVWMVLFAMMLTVAATASPAEPEQVCRDAAAALTQSSPWSVSVAASGGDLRWVAGSEEGACSVQGGRVVAVSLNGADTAGAAAAPTVLECASRDNRRSECGFSGHGFVRIVEQLSDAACDEGISWGVHGSTIWVDRGCRARFEIVSNPGSEDWGGGAWSGGTWSGRYTVTCESVDSKRITCRLPAEGRIRVKEQLSDTRCDQGETWGALGDAIWVDRGCRAVFEVLPGTQPGASYRLTCQSEDDRREECALRGPGRAQVRRQLSETRCEPGQTFGVEGSTLWVDDGCRAEFEIFPAK